MERQKSPLVEKLLRGIATDHIETVRDAWRDILAANEQEIPAVLAKLDSKMWAEYPRGPLHKYLGILLALLDELDPVLFKKQIATLAGSKLHPLHRKTVEIMSERANEKPFGHIGPDIPVYISRDISTPESLLIKIDLWSKTRDLDLANITRIDVIEYVPGMGYLGRYNLFFSGIILTSPAITKNLPNKWIDQIFAEFVFYHEVGHHACGHIEGGQIADQEKEADDYARKMFRNAHPVKVSIAKALIFPFLPLLRRLVKKHKNKYQ